ncbi:MAG: transposase [Bacteroidales bacterium]|nr:transposase [Bacteroidales bacterium]
MDTTPIPAQSLERYYHIDGIQLERHYKEYLSDFKNWEAVEHAEDWLVFPENTGSHLSIDETSLSNGELYTIITNKAAKGRKGALVAMVEGIASEKVIEVLEKIPQELRNQVKEVTLDMAECMHRTVRRCFPNAIRVIDRFHVQNLAYDALQEMRIAHRWDAINEETEAMEQAKLADEKYIPQTLENGDSKKQLLARSRYLLFKSADKWTNKQKLRAKLLFDLYPDIKKAYSLTHSLRMIFSKNTVKDAARLSLARWYNQVNDSGFKSFNTISATIYEHYDEILNFFINRSTNASAEAFNAKIKAFRASLRGVSDMKFFLFRLSKIYA